MAARLLAAMLVVMLILVYSPRSSAKPGFASRERMLRILPMLSGQVMLRLAARQGVTDILGKLLLPQSRWQDLPRLGIPNEPVGNNGTARENEPSIALNPTAPANMVAAMHYDPVDDRCAVFRSTNGGATWSGPIFLPLVGAGDFCSDPVVRYSPDGLYVYAAFMSVRSDVETADVVVSRSTDNGATWNAPVVAIQRDAACPQPTASPCDFPDKPWLGVHMFDASQAAIVYVSSTIFRGDPTLDCEIVVNRSTTQAAGFPAPDAPPVLATAPGCDPVVLQGSNVSGGIGGEVLVCWYNSEISGYLAGSFDIRCRRSGNSGVSWGSEVTAVNNINFEVPMWMCPSSAYYRIPGAMFPQVRIAPNGSAHMVFTRDPTSGTSNGECGNIVYVRSSASPYTTWTAPATISTGLAVGRTAQVYSTLTVEAAAAAPGYTLRAFWVDQRRSWSPNDHYDIIGTVSTDGGMTWTANTRITGASSLTDFTFIGDYIDAASTVTTSTIRTEVIWTDRRDKTSIFDQEDDVFQESVP